MNADGCDAPRAVVERFIAAWNAMDFERIIASLADDVVYHNIPMEPVYGRAAVRSYLQRAWIFDAVNWETLNIAADGNIVLTERVDGFVINGVEITLPVMGVFEIEGGVIKHWRDYFDLNSYLQQLERAGVKRG